MNALKQGKKSVSKYASEFEAIVRDLEWNDAALMASFSNNLNFEIRKMLIGYPNSATLDELIRLATRCDTALATLNNSMNRLPVIAPLVHAESPGPNAMEIDALRRTPGPLTAEEREIRMRNGLCLVCGQSGHLRAACPRARHNRQDFEQGQ